MGYDERSTMVRVRVLGERTWDFEICISLTLKTWNSGLVQFEVDEGFGQNLVCGN